MSIEQALQHQANPAKAKILSGFFKTGKGEYGEGDHFLGITVPEQRKIAKQYQETTFTELHTLLQNKIHEYRLTALLILTEQYKKADEEQKKKIIDFYCKNTQSMNNWDLVDATAHQMLGDFLQDKEKTILYTYATSTNLWERRISIVSTFAFIRQKQFQDTIKIAEILLQDKHDLIHKAVGWMLREVGKKDQKVLEQFLNKHATIMSRTMLRYAIEKFPQEKRQFYMKKI